MSFNLLQLRQMLANARSGSPPFRLVEPQGACGADRSLSARHPEYGDDVGDGWPAVTERLRTGCVADGEFDGVYPPSVQLVSAKFWTPVSVARYAAGLLAESPTARVLDVGSGAGKFCIVGAAVTGATFVGVEHREHLVRTARDAARQLGVDRAEFVHGTFDSVDIEGFDAVYFFNPFDENTWDVGQLDSAVVHSRDRYEADLERAEALLANARVGTRVVTYHGWGGQMPAGYRRELRERRHTGYVELWVKGASPAARSSTNRHRDPLPWAVG